MPGLQSAPGPGPAPSQGPSGVVAPDRGWAPGKGGPPPPDDPPAPPPASVASSRSPRLRPHHPGPSPVPPVPPQREGALRPPPAPTACHAPVLGSTPTKPTSGPAGVCAGPDGAPSLGAPPAPLPAPASPQGPQAKRCRVKAHPPASATTMLPPTTLQAVEPAEVIPEETQPDPQPFTLALPLRRPPFLLADPPTKGSPRGAPVSGEPLGRLLCIVHSCKRPWVPGASRILPFPRDGGPPAADAPGTVWWCAWCRQQHDGEGTTPAERPHAAPQQVGSALHAEARAPGRRGTGDGRCPGAERDPRPSGSPLSSSSAPPRPISPPPSLPSSSTPPRVCIPVHNPGEYAASNCFAFLAFSASFKCRRAFSGFNG